MKFRSLLLILPFVLVAGGAVATNVLVGQKQAEEAIYSDFKKVYDRNSIEYFFERINFNKDKLDQDFVNEYLDAKPHIENLYNNQREITTYIKEYEYFSTKEFKFIDVTDLYNRFFCATPFLIDTKIPLTSDQGYTMEIAPLNSNYAIKFSMPKENPNVVEQFTLSEVSKYSFNYLKESKDDVKIYFRGPYIFDVETKAGTYRFNYYDNVNNKFLKDMMSINESNYEDILNEFSTYKSFLPENLVKQIEHIKESLRSFFRYCISYSEDFYTDYIYNYKYTLPILLGNCEPFISDETILSKCFVFPYLLENQNKTFTSDEGYEVTFTFNELEKSSHIGDSSLILNVPLESGGDPVKTIIYPAEEEGKTIFTAKHSAYKLIDSGVELSKYNAKFTLVSPYIFDLTTPAGTFRFDMFKDKKQEVLDIIKNITPENYRTAYNWLDSYLYLMPKDFIEEFNTVGSSVKKVLDDQGCGSSYSGTIQNHTSVYELLESTTLKYFVKEQIYECFTLYPYFVDYVNHYIYNNDGQYVAYFFGKTLKIDEVDTKVNTFEINLPIVDGGENVVLYKYRSYTNSQVHSSAFELIDKDPLFEDHEEIKIRYEKPYAVRVTTPAGSFVFDFKGNDDRILMETLSKVNDKNYPTTFENIEKELEHLPDDFKDEYNTLKSPLTYLFTKHYYSATGVDLPEYERIYHILFDKTYSYVDVEDFLQYFFIYPMLGDKEGVTFKCLENSDYSIAFIFNITNSTTKAGNLTVDYKIPTSLEDLDPEVLRITSSKTLTLDNMLFEFFDANSSYSSDNFNVKFRYASPTSFKAITPVGEFTFSTSNVDGNIEKYCIERLNNINQTNYNNVFTDIETHKNDLSEDFYSEYELVKPGLTTLLSVYGNYSLDENFANTETQVFKSFYIENSFAYVKVENFKKYFSLFPYFSTKNRETYKSKEGFTLTYIFDDPTFSPSTATVEFVIPMEEGADPTNVSIRTTKNYGNIHYSPQGAFYLFDDQSELKEKGISVTFVEPYVFDVTTPAGTFRFDIKNGKENTIYDEIKNITPDTYVEIFNYIDNYSYTLPEDLISEYNGVREDVKSIFSNYKSQDSLNESIIDTHTNLYNYIEENGLKYFDKDQLYKYFSLYPYFSNYVNEKIYSDGEENYILFASNQSLQVDDETTNADYFSVFVPLVEGGDPEEVLWHLPHSDSNNTQAHKLIDADNLFERDDISITFVEPYVVKVTTPAGSFLFDFKANDKRILMESLSKVNDSNYTEIFANIDKNISELPADFVTEYNAVKDSLTFLFTKHDYDNIGVGKSDYDRIYSVLFDNEYKYIDPNNFLKYFSIYPYLLDKTGVEFKCVDDERYSFTFTYDEKLPTLQKGRVMLTFIIPLQVSEVDDPITRFVSSRNSYTSDLTLPQHLYLLFDDCSQYILYDKYDLSFEFVSPGVIKAITPAGEYLFEIN